LKRIGSSGTGVVINEATMDHVNMLNRFRKAGQVTLYVFITILYFYFSRTGSTRQANTTFGEGSNTAHKREASVDSFDSPSKVNPQEHIGNLYSL